MSDESRSDNPGDPGQLFTRLAAAVGGTDRGRARETAASIAYSLGSLETQFQEFLRSVLPELRRGDSTVEETQTALLDAGLVFQQVYWHLKLCKYWRSYLLDPDED